MARANPELIEALRQTAARLREGSPFAWGHMGNCICGHLAQTVTDLSAAEIHRRAMERHGDWATQAVEHCPTSGLAIDHVLDALAELGLGPSDVRHLERLSDPRVLARVPAKWLRRQDREHAVQYMEAMAEVLDAELGGDRTAPDSPARRCSREVTADAARRTAAEAALEATETPDR